MVVVVGLCAVCPSAAATAAEPELEPEPAASFEFFEFVPEAESEPAAVVVRRAAGTNSDACRLSFETKPAPGAMYHEGLHAHSLPEAFRASLPAHKGSVFEHWRCVAAVTGACICCGRAFSCTSGRELEGSSFGCSDSCTATVSVAVAVAVAAFSPPSLVAVWVASADTLVTICAALSKGRYRQVVLAEVVVVAAIVGLVLVLLVATQDSSRVCATLRTTGLADTFGFSSDSEAVTSFRAPARSRSCWSGCPCGCL